MTRNGDEVHVIAHDVDQIIIALCMQLHRDFPELVLHDALGLELTPPERSAL